MKRSLILITVLLAFLVLNIPKGLCFLEDFTSYTEEDPNSNITVYNATHMKQHVVEDEDCYLWRDYGVNYFQYGTFLIDARVENMSAMFSFFLMFSNYLDDRKWLVDNEKNYICLLFGSSGIYLQKSYVGVLTTDSYLVAEDNKWWSFTVVWNTTAIYAFVYNNTARTAEYLEDTLTVATMNSPYRYMLATNTRNRGVSVSCDLLLRNMDLGLPDTVDPSYNLMGLNSTLNGSGIQLTINLTDNGELDTALLEWNNSGTLTNISMSISGSSYLCLFNQTLNETEGRRVEYKFYFNDTTDNWGETVQHFLITNTEPVIVVVTVNIPVLFVGASLLLGGFGFLVFYARKKK